MECTSRVSEWTVSHRKATIVCVRLIFRNPAIIRVLLALHRRAERGLRLGTGVGVEIGCLSRLCKDSSSAESTLHCRLVGPLMDTHTWRQGASSKSQVRASELGAVACSYIP